MGGMLVTIERVDTPGYIIREDPNDYSWTDEMLEPVEEELTAEEAIGLLGYILCSKCPVKRLRSDMTCRSFRIEDKLVAVLKQYKKDHEKKEIEVVQKTYCLVIDEKRTVVHEEEIDSSDSCEEVLKRYCEEHEGKFFAICESRYAIKE